MENRFVKAHKDDFVATALVSIDEGEKAGVYSKDNKLLEEIESNERIPYGHKIALKDINVDELVIKYGEVIGKCTDQIKKGDLVHVHNVISLVNQVSKKAQAEIMQQVRAK